ncbi:MAG: hypothetical protein AB1665_04755 [Candidatus Thermoplasmatota archaeon]
MSAILKHLTERNCLIVFCALFALLAVWIASVPYEPMKWDLADATTNYIWTGYYAEGRFHVTWDEWTRDWGNLRTQSSVAEYDGQYVVVNEKGPGLAAMLVPFRMAGTELLFAPLMIAYAVLGTYVLGKRILGWRTGIVASCFVLTNLTVLVMWHRYYWTDAATMHLLVLALALFLESFYYLNGRTLDPREVLKPSQRDRLAGAALGLLAGLIFGAAVSTRYAVALVGIAMPCYLLTFYLVKLWPELRKGALRKAICGARGLIVVMPFLLGLMLVLVPLMQYNTAYFGGPFRSGYDATKLTDFDPAAGLEPRNTSAAWSADLFDIFDTAVRNFFLLLPILVSRMPFILLAPVGFWFLRKKPWLALLLPWMVIAMGTYLSLSWVAMYARFERLVPWEPRYFMPAIPPLAIAGAIALDSLAFKFIRVKGVDLRNAAGAIFVLIVVGIIALWGLAPAAAHFSEIGPGYRTPGGPPPPLAMNVTIDQLLKNPNEYLQRFVRLENVSVVEVIPMGLVVQSSDAQRIAVRLDSWPHGTLPQFRVGDRVDLGGIFMMESLPDQPPRYFMNVKYGTEDYIRLRIFPP